MGISGGYGRRGEAIGDVDFQSLQNAKHRLKLKAKGLDEYRLNLISHHLVSRTLVRAITEDLPAD